ncbi:MAG: transglutaminase family protein [Rhodospirillaceae bacterium]|nr:transglutaminase family protein [Rhodospirillales bacterium]
MQLAIEHHTDYGYSAETSYAVQYVRLTPRDEPGQRVLRWDLDVPGQAVPWRDSFGNLVHCVVQTSRHDHLHIRASGEVDTAETHGIVPVDPHGLPPAAYLRTTPLTMVDGRIRDFAAPFGKFRARGDLALLHALLGGLHDTVAYSQGDTHVHSSASDALAQGSGVCQDHAHLFIACCRTFGIPARYVSGYLHTSAEDGRHLATHAWAEALVPDLGWVSFDPSNRQSATQAYVRLAVAFDYQGAAPVRGMRLGGGHEEMNVTVQVADMFEQ